MCDLKSLLEKIYQKGSAMVGLKEAKTFLNAVRNTTGSVATADDGDLMNHYQMFVANLETLFIKSCKKFDSSILDSKEIIQSILKKENITLLSNVKVIIQLICVACVKVSIESLLSWYVKIFDFFEIFTLAYEKHSIDKMIIAEDGPITTCWWNTRTSNEPILERYKQQWQITPFALNWGHTFIYKKMQ